MTHRECSLPFHVGETPGWERQESYQLSARVWGTIEGIKVKMLLDIGAEENITGKELASQLQDAGVAFYPVGRRQIGGFSRDLELVPVTATTEVLLRVGPVALRDTMVVIDNSSEEAIIRFGFQFLAKLIVDSIAKCVRCANFPEVTLPLSDRTEGKQLLKAPSTVVTPARSEMLIDVQPTASWVTPVRIRPFHAAGRWHADS